MTVFASAPGHGAHLERDWTPSERALAIDLAALPEGGSVIFPEATGRLPGLKGRLNPVRDTHDRTYLYASNIAVDEGEQQPVHFIPGEELQLTDAEGTELRVRIRRYRRPVGACRVFRCPASASMTTHSLLNDNG